MQVSTFAILTLRTCLQSVWLLLACHLANKHLPWVANKVATQTHDIAHDLT